MKVIAVGFPLSEKLSGLRKNIPLKEDILTKVLGRKSAEESTKCCVERMERKW
jgi:hypothetical protein